MALSVPTPIPFAAVQAMADHFGITGFAVVTPQDESPQQLLIYSESWCGAPGPSRTQVTPLAASEYIGQATILPLLTAVGAAYETYRANGVQQGQAIYNAIRDVLQQTKQTEGVFPANAT